MKIKKHLLIINTLNWFFIIITFILSQPLGPSGSAVPILIYDKLPICASIDLILAFGLLIINFLVISKNKLFYKNNEELSKSTSITLLTLNIISFLFTIICIILLFAY